MASLKTRLKPGKKRAPQLLADSTLMRCALDRLGQSMLSPATAPRLEFRQSLRAELVGLATVQAQSVRLPGRPPKVRKPKAGFRLAALGLGISAAGGGFALAANRAHLPELPSLPAHHSAGASPHARFGSPTPPVGGYAVLPDQRVAATSLGAVPSSTPASPLAVNQAPAGLSTPAVNPSPSAQVSVPSTALPAAPTPLPTLPVAVAVSPPPADPLLAPLGSSSGWPHLLPTFLP